MLIDVSLIEYRNVSRTVNKLQSRIVDGARGRN